MSSTIKFLSNFQDLLHMYSPAGVHPSVHTQSSQQNGTAQSSTSHLPSSILRSSKKSDSKEQKNLEENQRPAGSAVESDVLLPSSSFEQFDSDRSHVNRHPKVHKSPQSSSPSENLTSLIPETPKHKPSPPSFEKLKFLSSSAPDADEQLCVDAIDAQANSSLENDTGVERITEESSENKEELDSVNKVTNLNGVDKASEVGNSEKERKTKRKSVKFPPNDSELVTSCLEPRKPHFYRSPSDDSEKVLNVHEVLSSYVAACRRMKVQPSSKVEKQISTWHTNGHERQDILCLKGEKVRHLHMECLEEIFRRVQFQALDFEYSFLDDDAIVGLADMIEFYDSAYRLNLSFNQNVGARGWQAIFRMLRKNPYLEHLNLRYTSLNERSVPLLARSLRGECSLVSLHLENCSLSGRSLLILVCALKDNKTLKELYLAENNLGPNDAAHVYQLISGSSSIQLLDLRNNALQDAGMSHVCDSLRSPGCKEASVLNTLVLWNNRITGQGMKYMARALTENKCVQTLNLGCNSIGSEGLATMKDSLARNRTLLRLGLQATKLNCQGAITIAECIADNPTLVRVDLRDNPDIRSAGLLALNLALKMNGSITTLNLDRTCCQPANSRVQEYSEQFQKIYNEIQEFCDRNRKKQEKRLELLQKELRLEKERLKQGLIDQPISVGTEKFDEKSAESNLCDVFDIKQKETNDVNNKTDNNEDVEATKSVLRPRALKFCDRQISLTCEDPVPDFKERIKVMPPGPPPQKISESEDENDEDEKPSTSKSEEIPSADNTAPRIPQTAASITPEQSTAVQTGSPSQRKQQRFSIAATPCPPTVTPISVTPAVNRFSANRFSVSCVPPAPPLPQEPGFGLRTRPKSRFLVTPRREEKKTQENSRKNVALPPPESAEEIDRIARSVVSDLVTFSSYEIGDFAYTPSVSKSKRRILSDFEKAAETDRIGRINEAKKKLVREPVEKPVRKLVEEPVSPIVKGLVREMVKFCDFQESRDLESGRRAVFEEDVERGLVTAREASKMSNSEEKAKCSGGCGPTETEDDRNAAVKETVRELVKNCIQMERDTLRASVRERRKKLVSKLKKFNPET